MLIHENIPLKQYLTMKLGGKARFMIEARTPEDVAKICQHTADNNLPLYVLGGGSNTLAHDEIFQGVILLNRIPGYNVIEDNLSVLKITVGAGENWDETVKKTVDAGCSGIAALSMIPGTVGAAPVQNIGAYGQEVSDAITEVYAYDREAKTHVLLKAEDCCFSYRDSIFRGTSAGRFVITSVTMELAKGMPTPPFYKAVEEYFAKNNVTIYTPDTLREAVTAIRVNKLPNPKELPNTGSFFKNAVIDSWLYDELKAQYPEMPAYEMPDDQYKIPTGWLIEQAGLKGKLLHGMRVHDKNTLVLINESATSYADLASARHEIITAVQDKFRITITQEPLEIG